MTAAAAPAPVAAEPALACGNCREPMQRLSLAGHYGRRVEIDLCPQCHLVWFDQTETARLAGPGLLALIGAMAGSQGLPHRTLDARAGCARCGAALKTVHNRSRWGRSLQLECPAGHGAHQTFAEFLQEKGLLRPMSRIDRAALAERRGHLDCVNCGGAVGRDDAQCRWCGSVPALLDVARLARALDPEGAIAEQPVHRTSPQAAALQCAACGAALPPEQSLGCAQCGATLAVGRLADAHAQVEALGPALRAHAERPAPAVVKRRLDALDADLPRRRQWVRDVEAQTQNRREAGDGEDLAVSFAWWQLKTNPLRAVLIALVLWFAWWFWP